MSDPANPSLLDMAQSAEERAALSAVLRTGTYDAEFWFTYFAKIRLKTGSVAPVPAVNTLQERVFDHYRYCTNNGRPCLIMILKPRQKGASTVAQGLIYFHMRKHRELNGLIMGDVIATSDKVFDMYRRYAELDTFAWGDGLPKIGPQGSDGHTADFIRLPNGSTYSKETAGSSNAGRSGTVQVLHLDEVAFFTQATGKDPTTAVMGSFAKELPVSLGFATSTPNGATGWYYNTWHGKNAWHKIFAAWYEFEDSYRAFASPDERAHFEESLTDDEVQEQQLYGVSLEQLNWRRNCIETDYEGDSARFRQEMASDPETCFLLSSSLRFDMGAIKEMAAYAKSQEKPSRCNLIIQNPNTATLMPDPRGDVEMVEQPIEGCRYVIAVDTCTGADQQGEGMSKERDYHSAQVWRQGYTTKGGDWRPPALVALHHSQVDTDVLAEIVAAMSIYYGKCLVVPEINGEAGIHIVKQLQTHKVPMFRRVLKSAQSTKRMTEEEKLGQYGWRTDAQTKKHIIDHMVPLIRKRELDIRFQEVVDELRTFVKNDRGTAEAMPGKRDDHVLAAAIALYNIGAATEFKPIWMRQTEWRAPDGFRAVG